ncbi:VOC family protein [Mycobacterium sp. URHB0044]|jgi:glyoxylase I family protein|uniref:VOC family protein n=1 Tax=Mycobacterium sp. URHB0044 TaxID=1380386 RepID=UPI0009DF8C33|nr:VOC family protein [Mycobacterium sp. URHB0044]
MPRLMGVSHVELTVFDCDRSAVWWHEVLGFTLVNRTSTETFEIRSLLHPSGMNVNVMTHTGTAERGAFDERRVGLDHLAFQVSDRDELQHWLAHLDAMTVPNSGIIDIGYGPTVVFRDPDNMQLEFFVHPDPNTVELTEADSPEAQKILRRT